MFGERFITTRGAPFEVDGRLLHGIYRRQVMPGETFAVAWVKARKTPLQGIRLKLDKGRLRVAGERIADVVMWRGTAPAMTVFTCECRAKTVLKELELLARQLGDHASVDRGWRHARRAFR